MGTIDIISVLLKKQNKKQKDLTDYLGLKKNAFTNWKNGHTESYKKYLPQISKFFGVSIDYLLGVDESDSNTSNNNFFLRTPEEEQELNEYLEAVRTNPELRMMFSLTKNAKKEDVEKAVQIIKTLLGK